MKELCKELIRSTVISIGMAMAIFCIVGIVFDVKYAGNFSLENYQFTKNGYWMCFDRIRIWCTKYRVSQRHITDADSCDYPYGNRLSSLYHRGIFRWVDWKFSINW